MKNHIPRDREEILGGIWLLGLLGRMLLLGSIADGVNFVFRSGVRILFLELDNCNGSTVLYVAFPWLWVVIWGFGGLLKKFGCGREFGFGPEYCVLAAIGCPWIILTWGLGPLFKEYWFGGYITEFGYWFEINGWFRVGFIWEGTVFANLLLLVCIFRFILGEVW